MKTVTIQIRDEEYAAVKREAEQRGVGVACVVRERAGFEGWRKYGAPAGNQNNPWGGKGKPKEVSR